MLDLNEFQTRKQKIDVLLKEQGWDISDRSRVILEVDTKQSNFKNRTISRLMRPVGTMQKASMRITCYWTAPESRLRLSKQNDG